MSRYRPVPLASWYGIKEDKRGNEVLVMQDHYAIRDGGSGGRLLGTRLELTRDDCVEIISWLEEAFESGLEWNAE